MQSPAHHVLFNDESLRALLAAPFAVSSTLFDQQIDIILRRRAPPSHIDTSLLQSPAHRVLFNDELLRALIAALLPGGPSLSERHTDTRLCRRTVKNLACACKSFTGPALDLLWQELPSLRPLIPLLLLAIADLRNGKQMILLSVRCMQSDVCRD